MGHQIVLQDWKVRHGDVDHGFIIDICVFYHYEITSPLRPTPSMFFEKFIDGKGHSVVGDDWIKNDVGSLKLFDHVVERFGCLLKKSELMVKNH